jgi:putative membrane protein
MENSLRDQVISSVKGVEMLEVCTSDTHSTSGIRTKEGYLPFGSTSNPGEVAATYGEMCQKAAAHATECSFELAGAQSRIKVMGKVQFEDYSRALDKSMNITKVFLGVTFATYVATLIFS